MWAHRTAGNGVLYRSPLPHGALLLLVAAALLWVGSTASIAEPGVTFDDIGQQIATTGDPFNFTVTVASTTGVGQVRVMYWFGTDVLAAENVTMTGVALGAGGNGTYFHGPVTIPADGVEPLRYVFVLKDGAGIWHQSTQAEVAVIDNDIPHIEDRSDAVATTGETFHFKAIVTDNVGLEIVLIQYLFVGKAPVSVTWPDGNLAYSAPDTFTWSITVPSDSIASFSYFWQAMDGNDENWVKWESGPPIAPRDNDGPVVLEDLTEPEALKGRPLNMSVRATDNIGVVSAYLEYWFGLGARACATMEAVGGGVFNVSLPIPRETGDALHYFFRVEDAARNSNTTSPAERQPVNKKPRMLPVGMWVVTERELCYLDLTPYLRDENDPPGSLSIFSLAIKVDAQGLTLVANYTVWMMPHTIYIQVSDGEDEVEFSINVTVKKVPVITSTPPTAGEVNATYGYKVTWELEDPMAIPLLVLVRKPAGMSIDSSGRITWTPNEDQHDNHDVDLALTHGGITIRQAWTIRVTRGPDQDNREPVFTNAPRRDAVPMEPYSWDFEAADPDGDALYFHLLQGPPGARMNNSTGRLTWLPEYPQTNMSVEATFQVEVTDGIYRIPKIFTVRVRAPADKGPEIKGSIPDVTATEKTRLRLSRYMSDPDDPVGNLSWRIEVGDVELFTAYVQGNDLFVVPRAGARGSASVRLVLEDPSGLSDDATISVEVRPSVLDAVGMPLAIVVLVCMLIVLGTLYVRRRGKGAGAVAAPAAGEAVVTEYEEGPVPSARAAKLNHIVEEVLVVYHDGRLIADCAREECKTKDADLMSGMLITIQGIIQDGLERGGELESIKYGDNNIVMACGDHVNVATVIYGEPDAELRDLVEHLLAKVEGSFAGVIEDWTGDLSVFDGIDKMVAPLLKRTEGLERADITKAEAYVGVTLLSAVDFHRGYVRLKVATINATKDVIVDAAVEVRYDPDMLRLERLDPPSIKLRGDRATLGNVKPGEKKTVAFLFDPQICQETHIDGTLTYYDTKGEMQRVEMKRRQADVVCPIFFTKEHANTAMLRRLIKEKLDQSDVRLFTYTKELSPEIALVLGKSVAGGDNVQLVREYVVEGPPFEAEVWYYGETKVKGYQIVMRLSILDERKAIEFFAASTAMEPVTGLLAEFRRDLERLMQEKYAGTVKVQTVRDEVLKRELELRQLFLFTFGEKEGEGG